MEHLPVPPRRDAAMLAEVISGVAPPPDADDAQGEAARIDALIAAAAVEVKRQQGQRQGGVAPVLGPGVLQRLLQQGHAPAHGPSQRSGDVVDERR